MLRKKRTKALFSSFFLSKAKNECILNMFGITISCDLKLPMCKNYMNFADTAGIFKYKHFGSNFLEISPFLLKLLRKYKVLMGQSIALKTLKTCLVCDVISIICKLNEQCLPRRLIHPLI